MIKKTVNYTTFDGEPATDVLYFNLTKTEMVDLLEMEPRLQMIAEKFSGSQRDLSREEVLQILEVLKDLMRVSYGQRSDDGKRFKKSPEIWDDFKSTAAYDAFLWHMFENPTEVYEFMANIIPSDLRDEAAKNLPAGARPKVSLSELQKKSSE